MPTLDRTQFSGAHVRRRFHEEVGAIRDVVQNSLLLLMTTLVAIDAPAACAADAVIF